MTAPQQVTFVPGVGVFVRTTRGDWITVEPDGATKRRADSPDGYIAPMPLVAASQLDDLAKAHQEHITELREQRDTSRHELSEAIRLTVEYVGPKILPAIEGWSWFDALVKYAPETAQAFTQAGWGHLSPAATDPAPLDPGNPDDWRQVAELVEELDPKVARLFRSKADRLDRKRAEAEQDLADRRCADEIVTALTMPPNLRECPTAEHATVMFEAALAGIRSERERAEKSGAS